MIMKIYGFISELKEELKKGVFRFVFERKSRTERDDMGIMYSDMETRKV